MHSSNRPPLMFGNRPFFTIQTFCLLLGFTLSMLTQPPTILAQSKFAVAVHGGAGRMPAPETHAARLDELNRVLDLGLSMLDEGRSSLDVVESVIQQLEDCEFFNAGRGCVLNEQGEYELDASIMEGRNLRCGAVAGVKTVRHPISLARIVMDHTKHVLLIGPGADQLGKDLNLPQAGPDHFVTERQRQKYLQWKKATSSHTAIPSGLRIGDSSHFPNRSHDSTPGESSYFGTVGCVVLDKDGNLAAGTSTGGLLGKRWGRVGDSPIIGAGNYADNATCAVSGTGIGEEFIRFSVASDIAARVRYSGRDLETAAKETLARLPADCGGVICVDRNAVVKALHNTPAMSYAIANSLGYREVQLFPESSRDSAAEGQE